MERHYESVVRQCLEGVVLAAMHPQTSVLVVIEVRTRHWQQGRCYRSWGGAANCSFVRTQHPAAGSLVTRGETLPPPGCADLNSAATQAHPH